MRDHRSIIAWQVANEVAKAVLKNCRLRWKPSAATLFNQLQRSALSVQLNIAEGYALRTRRRFHYHLGVAYGSAVETGELLELALAEEMPPELEGRTMLKGCQRSQYLLLGLLRRYRPSDHGR